MTRERIEDIREVILPFVKKRLLETNYEGFGKSDAEEFTRDFNEILDLAIKALEQESCDYIVNRKLEELFERVENIEKQIKEDKEKQLKKLKAEIDYAKFRCSLPTMPTIPDIRR